MKKEKPLPKAIKEAAKDLIREAKKATKHNRIFVVQHSAAGGRISAEFTDAQMAADYFVKLEGEAALRSRKVRS